MAELLTGGRLFLPLLVVTALLASWAPGARAADAPPGPNDLNVNDLQGDVVIHAEAAGQAAPNVTTGSDRFDHVDLLRLWVGRETVSTIEVGVVLKSLQAPGTPSPLGGRTVTFYFQFGERHYRVRTTPEPACPAILAVLDPSSQHFRGFACVAERVDTAEKSLSYTLPRELLTDENRVSLGPGGELRAIWAEAEDSRLSSPGVPPFSVAVADRVPNVGTGGSFYNRLGPVLNRGDLALGAQDPIRASNGESTTIVYSVRLVNRGDQAHSVALKVENPVSSFTVRAPARLDVRSHGTLDFPVILTMAFEHRHGEVANFTIRAVSLDDASEASVKLGVYWLEIPQPSGHHPTLWFHSAESVSRSRLVYPYQESWLNTMEKDPSPSTTEEDVYPRAEGGFATQAVWLFNLRPGLRIGLSLDPGLPGSLTTSIRTPTPIPNAFLNATLEYYCSPEWNGQGWGARCPDNGRIPVAFAATAAQSWPAGSRQTVDLQMVVNPAARLIPYHVSAGLALRLTLTSGTPQVLLGPGFSPAVVPSGSRISLPFLEYHDPVEQAFRHAGSLEIRVAGDAERLVNPGSTVVFPIDLESHGDHRETFRLDLEGYNHEWGRIRGEGRLALDPGARQRVLVGITAPDDAQAGERAEIFLVAESVDDANLVAITRLRASVVPVEQSRIPDEARLLEESSGHAVPSLDAVAACVAVGALGVMGLRRRSKEGGPSE